MTDMNGHSSPPPPPYASHAPSKEPRPANEVDEETGRPGEADGSPPTTVSESSAGCLLRAARFSLKLLDSYSLLAFVLLGIGVAAADPNIGVDNGPLRSRYSISYGATIVIFLIMGLGLDAKDLVAAFSNVRFSLQLGVLQFYSLLFIPFITWLVSLLLAFSSIKPVLIAGLVITACLPTTIFPCIALTNSAGGNDFLAIAMAAIGNSIGVIISPLTIVLFSSHSANGGLGASKIGAIYLDLFVKVIAPLIVGILFKNFPIEKVKKPIGGFTKVRLRRYSNSSRSRIARDSNGRA